jgi:hypothetical protein
MIKSGKTQRQRHNGKGDHRSTQKTPILQSGGFVSERNADYNKIFCSPPGEKVKVSILTARFTYFLLLISVL